MGGGKRVAQPSNQEKNLHLGKAGHLEDSPVTTGEASVCSPLWVGLSAGEVGRYGNNADWPSDQREDDGGSLVFVSDPLLVRTEILGAPQLHLKFSSDKPQALVSVRLNDVAPDGSSTRVTVGLLNLTHWQSHEHPAPLTPGKWTNAVVDLDDIAHAFPPGHRIAVSISTNYWPIAWPSPELATVAVALGESFVTLPVRTPYTGDNELRPFDPAICAPPTPTVDHPIQPVAYRSVYRDLYSGKMIVDFPRYTYNTEMTDIDRTCIGTGLSRYSITDGDPLSARCDTEFAVRIVRPDGIFGHESKGSLTCDATHFHVQMELRITENGDQIFRRSWNERIPRDHM